MGSVEIAGMIFAYLSLLIPFAVILFIQPGLFKDAIVSVMRMSLQLFLAGLYITVLFKWNSGPLNIAYLILMVCVANYSLVKNSGLRFSIYRYTLPALMISLCTVLFWFLFTVYRPEPVLDARYLIPLSGMFLGNSMNRSIVTLERLFSSIRKDWEGFASLITMGATVFEAIPPYLRESYKAGLGPFLANMSTIGIVFLPGMMTGQILGGASPITAVKYQVTVMLAIFAASELSTILVLFFTLKKGFDRMGFLRTDIFRD